MNYKNIDGYPNYEVSDEGEVRNKQTGRILKGILDGRGYLQVGLCVKGKKTKFLIHRLVALAFIPNPDNLLFVDHVNGNRINNHIDNLRWGTKQENCRNRKLSKNNTSGIKGVCWNKESNKWTAQINNENGIRIHLGYFDTKEEAASVRLKKEKELFKEFYREIQTDLSS